MTSQHAVISGASIAGLSAAWWLRHVGWQVTVIERAPSFRDGGQNVDVRGVAREVLERMGLVDAVRARNTTETGTVIVDRDGKVRSELPSDGPDGATAELEVLRGDFARVILDDLPDGVSIVYGETIQDVDDQAGGRRATVTTDAGRVLDADLVVIAEGVRSRTRDRLFAAEGEVDERDLGVTMVFGTIPRTPSDDDRWRWYNAVGGRQVHLRPDPYGTTRAILAYAGGDDLVGRSRSEALATLRTRYADAGWQTERVLDGFDGSDDVYLDELTQIRMPRWHRGRVCVIGDAAWCVTPMGGGGASLALTSGYVLAASVTADEDLDRALDAFDTWMRPLVDKIQGIPKGIVHFAYPQTRLGLAARGVADKVLLSALFRPLAARLTRVADSDRPLPPLPETLQQGSR
ncbi:FAD-dependent monooxygenase [Curtobacterium sp. VKM Ac-2861]|jgi:2-polyprenyl-6-methoxyphenol hydroxylase-like FAD-dependent oxidoreductase|uniref:FAD-dependent monooxygenase n=1 Tax=unclassified Curtobacterium TaxID=257496 RepID=UPI000F476336|nr:MULTISPECIES: FAD-dependent monooxygenase [unclassified Curtobacterium]NQW92142.1 FAD-dependent monooxygenase [Curtobacterium sp. VKM Ac-2861]ROQ17401.1 2-polyprenyl-6-methoxyphenol hydroxylase-like FAD-dependent oxidoreductase [Curtobacterium sp. PhB171]ROQ29354.1 2-polyprenyl-6-methoxyphenol hydroxylase-like FAD-dependent oxidoreductase [Curtobacterium sp. PhB170]ROS45500.1 2-polyprenyl-6-methoxyphenol hydroxylase-like FAD-dependent oxidoreductase [Curtobacterium sp. PhB131]ROS65792.1 2-p